MKSYIAYYRVSTKKQQHGIDAQIANVNNYVNTNNGFIENRYSEKESGKNNDRAELKKAIQRAKETNSALIVAKLDRLSREVSFLFELKKELENAKVQLICLDIPDLNTLTLGIFATMAQHERELISKRTKEGLKAAKSKGVVLGKPENLTNDLRLKGRLNHTENSKNNENNMRAYELIKQYKVNGFSWSKMAELLNKSKFHTANGKQFRAEQVKRIYNKYK